MGFSRRSLIASSAAVAVSAVSFVAPPVVGRADAITFETPSIVDPVHAYGEPDIIVDQVGRVFASGPWGTGTQHSIWNASVDGGHTYRIVAQQTAVPPNQGAGQNSFPGGGDTDLALDKTGKQYFTDLAFAECTRQETTSNAGATTSAAPSGGCNKTTPGADRQWLVVNDPPQGTPQRSAYKGPFPLVYLEYAQAVSLLLVSVNSHPYWAFSNATVDPSPGGPGLLFQPAGTINGGGYGDPTIDQETGKVLQGFYGLGGVGLNIGTPNADGTLCFRDTAASATCPAGAGVIPINTTKSGSGLLGPNVSLDKGRNLWITWNSGYNIYAAVSPPDGDKWDQWSPAIKVSNTFDNDKVDVFPWIKAGGAGKADVVWYGSNQTSGVPSDQKQQVWNVFMSQVTIPTLDGAVQPASAATTTEVQVSPHPMHYNDICLSGTGCITNMPAGNRNLADFFQVTIDNTGAAEVVYTDTSNGLFQAGLEPGGAQNADHAGAALVTVARQNGGPGLFGTNVSGQSSAPTGGMPDQTGDALFPVIDGGPVPSSNVPAMDLLSSRLTLSGSTLKVQMKVLDLSTPTAAGPLAPSLRQYVTRWQMGNVLYYAMAEISPDGQTKQYAAGPVRSIDLCSVSGCTPHVFIYPEGAASNPNVPLGTTEPGTVTCPTIPPTVADPCVIDISVSVGDVGTPGPTSLLEEVGAYSFASSHLQAQTTNPQAEIDSNALQIDGICCYNWNSSAIFNGDVPEMPWAPGGVLAGVVALVMAERRRRRRAAL